mgnify:CR=1 FL=1
MLEGKVKEEIVCKKCNKPMQKEQNFYTSRRTDLYPGGWVDECKKCFTMHLNIYEPSSFLSLLEKIDVPYIKSEWDTIVDKHGNNPKTTSTAIFGRYIAKMKLKQFGKYKFIDTEKFVEAEEMKRLQEKSEKLAQINRYRDALDNGEVIGNIQELGLDLSVLSEDEIRELLKKPEELFDPSEYLSFDDNLTKEDKQYLLTKWGKTYSILECIKLEKLYNEMMESYDIRTASHIDYLLKICRVSLKIDQALECNDIDGFQKMTKVYDLLMKSAKFTAAQNKELSSDYTDSVGIIVAMCEEKGFIPKYHIERQDVVDITLNDMNGYLRKLVMNEMNLGNMIEIYLQKMQQEENREEGVLEESEEDGIIIISEKENEMFLKDEDFEDYNQLIEEEEILDEEMLKKSGDLIDR